jgi:apolipoprotein N-acyltransferase
MIMKKTYWAVTLVAVFMGLTLLLLRALRQRPNWHQKRRSGAWGVRRWLRLGRRRQDP